MGQPWGESNFIELNKYYHSNHLDLEKLDILEGISTDEAEYSEHLEGNPVEEIEVGVKVVDGLKAKSHIWEDFGAGKMVLQVINTGLRLNFTGKVPSQYKEPNNKSFKNNIEFGLEEVRKLKSNEVIEEVGEDKVLCINPMSVASNKKGKRRLCIDLSRHVNDSCRTKKFRVERVSDFTKVVKQGASVWYYDLKSDLHNIPVM